MTEPSDEPVDPRTVQRPASMPTDWRGTALAFWDETISPGEPAPKQEQDK